MSVPSSAEWSSAGLWSCGFGCDFRDSGRRSLSWLFSRYVLSAQGSLAFGN